jgi:hypothetical protein
MIVALQDCGNRLIAEVARDCEPENPELARSSAQRRAALVPRLAQCCDAVSGGSASRTLVQDPAADPAT